MEKINIEVAYAQPDSQRIIKLQVPLGTTVEKAVIDSKIIDFFPEINLTKLKTGIFSIPVSSNTALKNNDRVEIYRPLTIDPKVARRTRAKLVSRKRK